MGVLPGRRRPSGAAAGPGVPATPGSARAAAAFASPSLPLRLLLLPRSLSLMKYRNGQTLSLPPPLPRYDVRQPAHFLHYLIGAWIQEGKGGRILLLQCEYQHHLYILFSLLCMTKHLGKT